MTEYTQRLTHLQNTLNQQSIDAMIISSPDAITYYTGVSNDPLERLWLLIVQPQQPSQLIANTLFSVPDSDDYDIIWIDDTTEITDAFNRLTYPLADEQALHIGIDKTWSVGQFFPIAKAHPNWQFDVTSDLVDQQIATKSPAEQEAMREASAINDRVMARMISEVIPLGISELEAIEHLKRLYLEEDADGGFSFDPIVAYGANGADPHHVPDNTLPQIGDAVVIDIGCRHNGYCSDMTRTVYYGEVSQLNRSLYQIVKRANEKGISAVTEGDPIANVDQASRDFITEEGYGEYFTHRTGHFIGQSVHESGDVSSSNHQPIAVGNIFSVEPGIYLPNQTAVRIEDLIIVTEDGPEVINHYSKDLLVIEPLHR